MTDQSDHRFAFGQNWQRYMASVDDAQIAAAGQSLKDLLGVDDLDGKRFLDIGCGSGIFSQAARRLGAEVHSFDYDGNSVACTAALRDADGGDDGWRVEQGSVLDRDYLVSLGQFDIVYAWGVLHHTGELRQATENATLTVADGGTLVIAIYNDQGWVSRYWLAVKRLYNTNAVARVALVAFHLPYLFVARALVRAIRGQLALERGMSLWHDMIDWLGGYPFEVAAPEEVKAFTESHGFRQLSVKTCGSRHGCNEFVFENRAKT
jgi:2-polyprenyl-6-hydroxyphenyl methylase/3-demethylubiquinone-9 3-methyltransferase